MLLNTLSLLPVHLVLLTLGSFVAGASLTPPPLSASDSSTSTSGSSTPTSSSSSSGSSNGSATPTSTSSAEFPSLSGLSECANNCFGLAVSGAGCTSLVDVNCFCSKTNSSSFATQLVACVSAGCSGDLSSVESIAEQFCALASTSTSLTFPTSIATTFSNPFTSTTSSSLTSSSSTTAPPSSSSSTSTSSSSSTSASATGNAAAAHGLTSASNVAVAGALGLGGALLGVLLG